MDIITSKDKEQKKRIEKIEKMSAEEKSFRLLQRTNEKKYWCLHEIKG